MKRVFVKKPIPIEATQFTLENIQFIRRWVGKDLMAYYDREPFGSGRIRTLEGTMTVNPGDWIIKGVKGEFYPCKPDIFALTYEPVEDLPESKGETMENKQELLDSHLAAQTRLLNAQAEAVELDNAAKKSALQAKK